MRKVCHDTLTFGLRTNPCPKAVTVTVAGPNSTPSTKATTSYTPSLNRFQLNSNPNPLSVSQHTGAVSNRSVPQAATCTGRCTISMAARWVPHTQPDTSPMLL